MSSVPSVTSGEKKSRSLAQLAGSTGAVLDGAVQERSRLLVEVILELKSMKILPEDNPNASWLASNCTPVVSMSAKLGQVVVFFARSKIEMEAAFKKASAVDVESRDAEAKLLASLYAAEEMGVCFGEVQDVLPDLGILQVRIIQTSREEGDPDVLLPVGKTVSLLRGNTERVVLIRPEVLAGMVELTKLLSVRGTAAGKRKRGEEEEDPSGEPLTDADGVAVVGVGKLTREKILKLQALFRLMPPKVFEMCFPTWELDIEAFSELWMSASSCARIPGEVANPLLEMFTGAPAVEGLLVVQSRSLLQQLLLGLWPLFDMRELSLLSFRNAGDTLVLPVRDPSQEGKFTIARLVTEFLRTLGVFFHPCFRTRGTKIVDTIVDPDSECATMGDEYLLCRLNKFIGGWFVKLRTWRAGGDTSLNLRGESGADLLMDTLGNAVSPLPGEKHVVWPHDLWYIMVGGRRRISLPGQPPAGKGQSMSSDQGPSSGRQVGGVSANVQCPYHVAQVLNLKNRLGVEYGCRSSECPLRHITSARDISLAELEAGLHQLDVKGPLREQIRESAAKALD